MITLEVNYETQESILLSFDKIADRISKDINLKINNAIYRILDFEFYTYSDKLPDPHTYKNRLQLENCKFYLHASGIDITFGDKINYGGILLRGIVKLYDGSDENSGFMKQQFIGPQIVATELFSNLNPLNSVEKNEIVIIDTKEDKNFLPFCLSKAVMKTKRIGLTSKENDKTDFYKNLRLRYIIVLPNFPKFKQIIKGIEGLLTEKINSKEMSLTEAKEILGYNIKIT